jgi:hypothetical protein
MTQKDVPLCVIHFGRAETEAQARETADMMKNCPYTVMYVSIGMDVLGVLVLPESKKWWADLQDNPELLGLSSLQVFFYREWTCTAPGLWVWSSQSWLSHPVAHYALPAQTIWVNAKAARYQVLPVQTWTIGFRLRILTIIECEDCLVLIWSAEPDHRSSPEHF